MDLPSLISSGEGQTTEFKESMSMEREAMEALCSMVNADTAHGTVIFGITPDGDIYGVDPEVIDGATLSLSKTVKRSFDPPLKIEINAEVLNGKHLILITAQRQRSIPYHEYDGRVWIRHGSENRLLTLDEKDHLRKMRVRDLHEGPWICDRCGNWARQLESSSVADGGRKRKYDCGCGGNFWPGR